MQMKLKKWTMPKALVVAMGLGLGTMALVSLSNPTNVHADNEQIYIPVGTEGAFSYGYGHKGTTTATGGLLHPVSGIRDKDGQYVFCIEWTKPAPGYNHDGGPDKTGKLMNRLHEKYDSEPAVQWLINNYYSGHRYQSLGQGDQGDYWLYQTVIHWIADPKHDYDETNKNHGTTGALGVNQAMNKMRETKHGDIADKLQKLHDKAMEHAHDTLGEILEDNHMMSFNPDKLEINKNDLKGDHYEKDFTFNSTKMKNVNVSLQDNPQGVQLEGANGGVDFHNVWDNTKLRIKIPYKINADKDEYKFKVAAKGTWTAQAKVAAIYYTSSDIQKVEKQIIEAQDVGIKTPIDMPVTVKPAKGSVEFTKKGTGSDGNDILHDTEFTLTGGNVKQVKKTDGNGYVKFDNLPLGQDYKLDETGQPNNQYLPDYHTTITSLNSDPLTLNENLHNVIDKKHFQNFKLNKKNANGQGLPGAKFVLVRSDQGSPKMSIEEAKKNALRQINDSKDGQELVEGHQDQQAFVMTADNDGKVEFNHVKLPDDGQQHHYYAVEVEAPKGYTLSQDSLAFNVSEKSPDTVTGELKDSTMPLPATGSEKLLVVTVAGVVLAVIAGGVVYFNRKKAH